MKNWYKVFDISLPNVVSSFCIKNKKLEKTLDILNIRVIIELQINKNLISTKYSTQKTHCETNGVYAGVALGKLK